MENSKLSEKNDKVIKLQRYSQNTTKKRRPSVPDRKKIKNENYSIKKDKNNDDLINLENKKNNIININVEKSIEKNNSHNEVKRNISLSQSTEKRKVIVGGRKKSSLKDEDKTKPNLSPEKRVKKNPL